MSLVPRAIFLRLKQSQHPTKNSEQFHYAAIPIFLVITISIFIYKQASIYPSYPVLVQIRTVHTITTDY
jgi:hypothetical protein